MELVRYVLCCNLTHGLSCTTIPRYKGSVAGNFVVKVSLYNIQPTAWLEMLNFVKLCLG